MKKLICVVLCMVFVLSATACGTSMEENTTNPPGGNGASKPASKEPPVLRIMDSAGGSIEANTGTYTWTYDNGDGTQTGVCADSVHPLEWQEFLVPMVTSDDTVELNFAVQPQEFTIRCWSDAYWGIADANDEAVTVTGNTLELKQGGYIYEIVAKWTGENLAAEGTAYFGFYVVQDDHSHTLAEDPQTVENPVAGYCGNTITKIHLDGKEYAFWGSDSVNLTDIVINLNYDPAKICRCMPAITVETESGVKYGINLSQGYVRCEDGQADITAEQVALIQKILENQT